MVFFGLFLLLVVMIAFAEIGLAAFIVLPLTAVGIVGVFSFIGMLMGVEGSGEIFLWCAAILGAVIGIVHLMEQADKR